MESVKTESSKREIDQAALASEANIARSAEAVKPALNKYVGSFVMHIYQQGMSVDTRAFNFLTQFVGDVPEMLAIEAAKELKTRMMERYGHVLKKLK